MAASVTEQGPTASPTRLQRDETTSNEEYRAPDPRCAARQSPGASFLDTFVATALGRCWHILVFYGAWATLVTVLNNQGHPLHIQPTLLTVLGTVLGFVIAYRTTSAFEMYNEGRRLWSQIIFATRTFACLVWLHVPDPKGKDIAETSQLKARAMFEKKSTIDLLEAFAVAVKHYLRGEDGVDYEDLYHLVKLPLASALPSETSRSIYHRMSTSQQHATPTLNTSKARPEHARSTSSEATLTGFRSSATSSEDNRKRSMILPDEKPDLLPASMPPDYTIFDLLPFSLFATYISNFFGCPVQGRKRMKSKIHETITSSNLPLVLLFHLSSYIASLQRRGLGDAPTHSALIVASQQLGDSLAGLERILTTPVPFSYSMHLWLVTIVYCLALPLQIWEPLSWGTIPATVIVSFIFFGFLAAGEEIENPFGYDKNDLNLDHFTSKIIRNELKAITSAPPPDPAKWVFVPENNPVSPHNTLVNDRVNRGLDKILSPLTPPENLSSNHEVPNAPS